jgi:hypothetical protein
MEWSALHLVDESLPNIYKCYLKSQLLHSTFSLRDLDTSVDEDV